MKILITEDKRTNLIKNYIISSFPEVHSVDINERKTLLGSGPSKSGKEGIITVNVITVNFKGDEMEYSPIYTLKQIIRQVDSLFGLDWQDYGSEWDFKYGKIY